MRALIITLAALLLHPTLGRAEWQDVTIPPPADFTPGDRLWYRCHIRVPDRMVIPAAKDLWRDSMMLGFSNIPGPFEVFLNGRSIAGSSGVPPGRQRRFKVPKDILEKEVFNALVIRLEGDAAKQGLTIAPVYFGYHHELVLDGLWQVSSAEPDAGGMKPLASQPASASYTETQFRRASTVLDATVESSPGKRVPPAEALERLQPGDGLTVEQLLHEPEVAQPTHVSFDGRGRMWVAQYRQYPFPAGLKMISRDMYYRSKYDRVPPPPPHHDRGADVISVHEDADGDGVYETHRRVLEGLNMANAALHGRGGIWVMQTPYLLFYPDADGDDVPDADPRVCLAGFGLEDTHSVANGLAWGPDGWLYGAQGSTTTSRVTRPGLDPKDSPGIYNEGCMVWRYHPDTHAYEIFADGSGNTFGLAFDAEGRLFSGHNGGDTRGWHHLQEGLYLKQGKNPGKFGPPPNPYAFGEMPMMESAHPVPRFSHMTIFADGPALPESLRGLFVAIDPLHQHVIAVERRLHGSTFSTADSGYALSTDDETFRPVYLTNGPDGAITLADFREEYIAHGQNYQGQIDPESGRIYRLRGKDLPLVQDRNLETKSTEALVKTLSHANAWHRQTAVRLLGERGEDSSVAPLKLMLVKSETHPALEALWALHQMGKLDVATAGLALRHPAPMVRAWAIRLMGDAKELPSEIFVTTGDLASTEPDAEVRAQILSTARRLPPAQAIPLVQVLAKRTEDLDDPFIPLLAWFTLESHCADNAEAVLEVFAGDPDLWTAPLARHHLLARLMRRFAEEGTRESFLICARLFAMAPGDAERGVLLEGFEQAFEGRALPDLPPALSAALANAGRGSLAFRVRAGEPEAIAEGMRLLTEENGNSSQRLNVIRAFGSRLHEPAVDALLKLALTEGPDEVRRSALTALLRYDREAIGLRVAQAYTSLPSELGEAALTLLASRPAWARAMLEQPDIPREDLGDDLLARLRLYQDENLAKRIAEHFPQHAAETDPNLGTRVAKIRAILDAAPGDPYRGEPIYKARCSACHQLFHQGGRIGPDLTSYQREDLNTLLPSLLAPSAEIREGFENYLVKTTDTRVLGGFLTDEDAHGITLRSFDGAEHTLSRAEITEIQPAGRSLMPDGLLDGLSDQELRDFFAYLRIPQPISP